jgi:hypothetical protein
VELGSHIDLQSWGPLENPEEIRWTSLLNEWPPHLSVSASGEDARKPRTVGSIMKLAMILRKQKTRGDAESRV